MTLRKQAIAISGLSALAIVLSAPLQSFAQPAGLVPAQSASPDIANCFDFYRFDSVQVHVRASGNAVSGTPITFSGTIANDNSYPIVDGMLYVKVFRQTPGTQPDGPDVVDAFVVKNGVSIAASSSVPVSFSWSVPANAPTGTYEIATYFSSSGKFDLLGLPFTDDVTGNTVPFSVSGEQRGAVQFDKSRVTINGSPYHFAAFPQSISPTSSADIVATAVNTTASDITATVTWKIYQWNSQMEQNSVQEIPSAAVKIPAHGSTKVTVTVSDARFPVYLAVGTLSWKDTHSVIGVRFYRSGIDRARINFAGLNAFPLRAGQPTTLFSCVHNEGSSVTVPGRLELTVSDDAGSVIASHIYSGQITGDMMGIADTFTPAKDYDRFTLDARLYAGNQEVDNAHLVYDCRDIDAKACRQEEEQSIGSVFGLSGRTLLLAIVSLILIIGILVVLTRQRRRSRSSEPGNRFPDDTDSVPDVS
jgi:hypothetical protein